jgi:hypothetical protein
MEKLNNNACPLIFKKPEREKILVPVHFSGEPAEEREDHSQVRPAARVGREHESKWNRLDAADLKDEVETAIPADSAELSRPICVDMPVWIASVVVKTV